MIRRLVPTLLWGALLAPGEVSFNRDIRPIMSDTCFRCHGPDKNARMANLRLDIREEAIKAVGRKAAPIVPGDPEKSAVVQRIFAADKARLMPPEYAHKVLTEKQKNTIKQWVAEGAKYEGHWAYQPLRRPAVPKVENAENPIDAFIRERLAREGLKPAAEADRRTLIRRVSLDLTGIPPAPAEIKAFVEDKAPDAYVKLVDRLLDSPRYAEKQTMHWLDAVRYADTCGFHGDNLFPAWPYRDYVLRVFRENVPFDRFTREQLAGDLLQSPSREQLVASAYNRLNRTSAEGGIQPKEYLAKYAADRVRTTAAVWLGATIGCAECHDHKFDPITTREFYSMKAFFADIKETGLVPDRGEKAWGSVLPLPSAEQEARLKELRARLDGLRPPPVREPDKDPVKKPLPDYKWKFQRPTAATSEQGATLTVYNDEPVEATFDTRGSLVTERRPGEGLIVASGKNPDNDTYTVTLKPLAGSYTTLALEVVQDESLPGVRVARGADRLQITEVEAALEGKAAPFRYAASNVSNPTFESHPFSAIDHNNKTGWGVTIYGEGRNLILALTFEQPLAVRAGETLTVKVRHDSPYRKATTGRLRIALSDVVETITATDQEVGSLENQLRWLEGEIPRIVVTEATEPSVTRVLPRGNFLDESGAVVEPAVPAFLGKVDKPGRATRLDLANWLVSKNNPLPARVFANRAWRLYFGTGLSKVLDDLGSQGEWPTHPELLDWLAAEFMEPSYQGGGAHAWDMKHLTRTIVLSKTYRQSSMPDAEAAQKDPDNRLLARQSRYRVDAEIVRDIALTASGLLHESFGGPSAKPYQPESYLAALNFPKREYSASRGEELYRRGLYTQWQRTFLHPSLMLFDAPSREECTVNRVNSNTPLQALVLLNDPIYVEAARVFAQHMLTDGGRNARARIEWAFWRALGRAPARAETKILEELYKTNLARFKGDPGESQKLISAGEAPRLTTAKPDELAATTLVARAILNLHETITRN